MPRPRPPAPKDDSDDVQATLRTRQERRQRRQAVEVAQAPIRERLGAEEGRDRSDPVQAKQQPVAPKKEVDVPPRRRLSREQRGPWAKEEESLAGREPAGGQKGVLAKSPMPEKPPALEKRLGSEETSVSERKSLLEKTAASERKPVLEKMSISEKPPAPRTTSGSQRRLVSEKASIFEKSPVSETKLAPKRAAPPEQPQAQAPPAAGGSQSATKGPEPRARAPSEKSPLSSAEQGAPTPPTVASRLPPITLQVGNAPAPPLQPAPLSSGPLSGSCPPTVRLTLAFSPCLLTALVRIGDTEAGQGPLYDGGEHIVTQAPDPRAPADWGRFRSFQKAPGELCLVVWHPRTCPLPIAEAEDSTGLPSSLPRPAAPEKGLATWGPHGSVGSGLRTWPV